MFSRIRIHVAVVLALLLVVTGQALAMARASTGPAGQVVICAGSGPVVVYLDEDGVPTGPPHVCPDFALHIIGDVVMPPETMVPVRHPVLPARPGASAISAPRFAVAANARAPPPHPV